MDLTPHDVDRLLGAWALDALDPEDRWAVDAAIEADPGLARKAGELRAAAIVLGERLPTDPPGDVRSAVLLAAGEHPPGLVAPTDPLTLFANQVSALHDLLGELTDDDFDAPTAPYDWTVHGLAAHLLVIERYTAGQLGIGPIHPDGAAGHLQIGAAEIADELRGTGAQTAASWHSAATATIEALAGRDGPASDAAVRFHQWPLSTESLLIARAFEVWTHTDDIRRATGRPDAAPVGADLRAMSQFSVASLPLVLPIVAPDASLGGARVVLTGNGGGTIDLGDPDRRDVLVATDVVDYCRLAARRIDVDDLVVTLEGDQALGRHLLVAARLFAV